ncbi:MAG TPA: hypothetical protein VFZ61_13345 [Polyangiales bacterium]
MIKAFGCCSPTSPSWFWSALALVWCIAMGPASVRAQVAPPPTAAPAPDPNAAPPPGLTAPPAGTAYAQPVPAPYYGQPGAVYAPPPRPPRPFRPRRGLMVAGISLLSASYMVAVVTGAVMLDVEREACEKCKDVGPLLFIPWAGPFAAISQAKEGDGLLVLLGVLQLAGAGLTIGGTMVYFKSKKRAEEQGLYTWDLRAGRRLALDVHTSPLRFGPSATLRF